MFKTLVLLVMVLLAAVPALSEGTGSIEMSVGYGIQNYDAVQYVNGQRISGSLSGTQSKEWERITANCGNYCRGSDINTRGITLNLNTGTYQEVSYLRGTEGLASMKLNATKCGSAQPTGSHTLQLNSNFNYAGGFGNATYTGKQSFK